MFSTSKYSFKEHESSSWWSLLDLKTGSISLLTNDSDVSEITWLGTDDSTILYINSTNADIPGGVELWVTSVSDFENGYVLVELNRNIKDFNTNIMQIQSRFTGGPLLWPQISHY